MTDLQCEKGRKASQLIMWF